MNTLFALIGLSIVSLAAALYYFLTRDTEKYRQMVEKRLKQLAQERGVEASKREIQLIKDELLSGIPPIQRVLLRFEVFNRLQTLLRQADMETNASKFTAFSLSAGLLIGTIAFIFTTSVFVMLTSLIAVTVAPLLYALRRRQKRFQTFLEQLPDALELMVRSLQAGHSFSSALQMVATEMPDPIAHEFGKAYEEQNLGLNIKIALENLVERVPIVDLKMCVTAVLIQREIGGNLAEVLQNISHMIRERFRIQGEIRVKSAQARLSGYIVSALPFFLFFWINVVNPNYMKSLYEHPFGFYILGGAMVMQVIGWLIIRKIVDIEV
jgi:tight adherence protein B